VNPELVRFTVGGHEYVLRAYSTFYTLAWIAGPLLAAWVARRRGIAWARALGTYALALAAGIAGARALDLFVAARYYETDPSRVWALGFSGFSLYGGLVVAALAGYALARAWRLPEWRLADAAVPGVALAVVLMRTGCFLNGCCYGLPTSLPWGVTHPVGSPVWQAELARSALRAFGGGSAIAVPAVHPTQLYEMAAAVALAALAWWLGRGRRVADGVPALVFAIGFTLARLGNTFLRARQSTITAPEWFYPAAYGALIAVLVTLLVLRVRAGRRGDTRLPPPRARASEGPRATD
jgi:phosphatidylglycerol:prolipoprotein diacylglycerol transferase